jgi:hypothetical protein
MGRKINIGNSEGILLIENDIKNKIIDYLFNIINLSKLRYGILDNIQKLKFLEENEHYITPNYIGVNYFLLFATIMNKQYAVLINRKKLSYHRTQIDIKNIFIVKIQINTNLNIFSGTLFDGKIIQKDNKYHFLIHDCFCVMGKKILDMEMEQKMLYLNDIINSNLSNNICDNFSFKLNKLYKYNDLPELIEKIIPLCCIKSNGIIFYPKYSGNSIIYIDKKQDKITIESSQNEVIKSKTFDIIYNFTEFLKSRVYSYEKESKHKILLISKTYIPDVYELYYKKDEPKIGIAHIPNLKISQYCANNINTPFTKVNCVYNSDFDKWIPLNIL